MGPKNKIDPKGPSPLNLIFLNNLNGPPTVIFKWAQNNNINPGGLGPLNLVFPTNLNGPPTIIFKWSQFKWTPNNNIDSGGPGSFILMSANHFKRIIRVKLTIFILKVATSGPHIIF